MLSRAWGLSLAGPLSLSAFPLPLALSLAQGSYRTYNVREHDVERTSIFLSRRHFLYFIS